jgi:hypothetical protein
MSGFVSGGGARDRADEWSVARSPHNPHELGDSEAARKRYCTLNFISLPSKYDRPHLEMSYDEVYGQTGTNNATVYVGGIAPNTAGTVIQLDKVCHKYCKKLGVQTGRGLLSIAVYKSIRRYAFCVASSGPHISFALSIIFFVRSGSRVIDCT